MRATLLGLILLNALYWAWSHWIDAPPAVTAPSTEFADLPSLQLVSELNGAEIDPGEGMELNLEDVQPLIAMDADPDREAISGPIALTAGTAGTDADVQGPLVSGSTDPDLTDPGSTDRGSTDPGSPDSASTDAGSTDSGSTNPGSSASGLSESGSSGLVPAVTIPFAAGQAASIAQGPDGPGPIPPDPGSQDSGSTGPASQNPASQDAVPPEARQSEADSSDAARTASAASVSEVSGGISAGAGTEVTATDADADAPEPPPASTGSTPQATNETSAGTDSDAPGDQPLLASSVVMASDPIANPARCDSVGPFLSLRQARAAVTLLNDAGIPTQQRVEEAEVWVGHWVHLPPYPTRDAAVAVVERLRREGVQDIYIETSEELRNSISLGLFSDIEGAEIRAGKVRKLGVRPQIVDRRRDGLVYWVDLELRAGSSIDIGMFDVLPYQTLRIESVACTGRLNARE